MEIGDRLARLAETQAFQLLIQLAQRHGAVEVSADQVEKLGGAGLCEKCRVALVVEVSESHGSDLLGVEVRHDADCPVWQAIQRAEAARHN